MRTLLFLPLGAREWIILTRAFAKRGCPLPQLGAIGVELVPLAPVADAALGRIVKPPVGGRIEALGLGQDLFFRHLFSPSLLPWVRHSAVFLGINLTPFPRLSQLSTGKEGRA
jgi:hypothetical protein